MKKQFMSTKEISEITGIAEQTLCNWRAKNVGLPYYRLSPRKIMYDRDEVLEIIRATRIETNN